MDGIVLASGIVLIAAILQACTGIGFSVMATPFLLLVYEPHTAIQINIVLSLIISLAMLPKVAGDIDRGLLMRLVKGSILGAPLGILVFLHADVTVLKIVVGLLIILLTGLLVLRFTLRQSGGKDYSAGLLSGLLTTSIGMPGPPLLLYFSGARVSKEVLRSTTLTFFLVVYLVSLLLQWSLGGAGREMWLACLLLAPVTGLGIVLGQGLFHVVNQQVFRALTFGLLGIAGSYLLITTLIAAT